MSSLSEKDLQEHLIKLCKRIVSPRHIVAACLYGARVCGYTEKTSGMNILLILDTYPPLMNTHMERIDGTNAFILIVDRKMFERDVRKGWLGEFVAEKIMTPYEPLLHAKYLRHQEVLLKKRTTLELLDNIILEFPVLSHELLIKREYFIYETMIRKARLFPPVTFGFLNMLRKDVRRKNLDSIMTGYYEAFNQLAKEDKIIFSNGYIKITPTYVEAIRNKKQRIQNFLRTLQKRIFLHLLNTLPKMMKANLLDRKIFLGANREINSHHLSFRLKNPKEFLLIPTLLGPATISDKSTIKDSMEKIFSENEVSNLKIEAWGGVLNDVYLLKFWMNQQEKKIILKKYRNWSGFKWFSLALWAWGTKAFAVLGRSRMEQEYTMNQFLHKHGIAVPKIYYVNHRERLIFEAFIEGESMEENIKCIISDKKETSRDLALVKKVGAKIAEIHKLGVALGDCKPENIIITKYSEIVFIDLEQARRQGDQVWDIAEFLYYSGHYVPLMSPAESLKSIAQNFVEGYLEAGGKKDIVKKVKSRRYTRVFSVFTPPHVILAISNICKGDES